LGVTEKIAVAGLVTTLLGALLGTLGGAVLNHFLARRKEAETRKQESKQRAYEAFAALSFLPDGFYETDEHFEQLARALAGMELYVALDVREAAKRMYNLELKRDPLEEGSEEYKRVDAELESARSRFLDAARKELRITVE
jgi:hypothetical protein